MEELKEGISNIENKNKKVELDKKWETSYLRRILICILTYIVTVAYSYLVSKMNSIFLSSLVPAIGFGLFTLSLKLCRKILEKYQK